MSNPSTITAVIDAMRSIQTESDRWELAEALHRQIPTGVQGFAEIIDAATAAGVVGGLKVNTLRLYRDAAIRWPSDKRVPNVSFSAHREAMVLPSIDAAAKMLGDLAKNLGPNKVTVASVRKAIAVKQGRPTSPGTGPKATPGTTTPAAPQPSVVLHDLEHGGSALIAAINANSELDRIKAGLNKVLGHVERLQAKAARAAKKSTTTAAPAASTQPPAASKAAAKKPQGDLRGM